MALPRSKCVEGSLLFPKNAMIWRNVTGARGTILIAHTAIRDSALGGDARSAKWNFEPISGIVQTSLFLSYTVAYLFFSLALPTTVRPLMPQLCNAVVCQKLGRGAGAEMETTDVGSAAARSVAVQFMEASEAVDRNAVMNAKRASARLVRQPLIPPATRIAATGSVTRPLRRIPAAI